MAPITAYPHTVFTYSDIYRYKGRDRRVYVRRQSNSSYWPTLIKSQELLCLTACVCEWHHLTDTVLTLWLTLLQCRLHIKKLSSFNLMGKILSIKLWPGAYDENLCTCSLTLLIPERKPSSSGCESVFCPVLPQQGECLRWALLYTAEPCFQPD